MSKFILIAHKPSSEDHCRGCLMASYSSDLEIFSDLSEDDLIQTWAKYLHYNMNLKHGEYGYEFWLFKDGIKVIEESCFCYYYDWDESDGFDYKDDTEEISNIISNLKNKAEDIAIKRKTKERI